jgi:hypothetical protein
MEVWRMPDNSRAEGAASDNAFPTAQVPAVRVYKYPLDLRSGPQIIAMPYGAKIVHVHDQVLGGEPHPVMWAEVSTTAPLVSRQFFVLATGHDDVPMGATYIGTIHVEWTVWHIYEGGRFER